MSGLRKQKQYDWKDSNLALFGSDTEKQVKKESAEQEPAWKNAGKKVGLQIWRIVKFKVCDWPLVTYGKFYDGDSYIILNTYKEEGSDQLQYDVHFWIGKYSSQDEYGTAAYKTVELDTYLDDVPIQHREVQGHESELFKSYFESLTYLHGGAESGFNHVTEKEYKPRLLHFHGDRRKVYVNEVPCSRDRLLSGDVFILDLGLTLYQWNGSGSNKDERFKALQYFQKLKSERPGKAKAETIDEESISDEHPFYKYLNESETEEFDDAEDFSTVDKEKELFRLSDASGKLEFKKEKIGEVKIADFDSSDVFILDTKDQLFVWIGKGTSSNERKNAMTYAHNYLMKTNDPVKPVSCIKENSKSLVFQECLSG